MVEELYYTFNVNKTEQRFDKYVSSLLHGSYCKTSKHVKIIQITNIADNLYKFSNVRKKEATTLKTGKTRKII